jgi:peptidoglycan/xylan/chitin deacetylase (PgdA/CDA1 family)
MARIGMSVGSHGMSHAFLNEIDEAGIEGELSGSQSRLSQIVGDSVTTFTAPGGRYNSAVRTLAKKTGYQAACTSKTGLIKNNTAWDNIPRFAIKRNMELRDFQRIVCQDKFFLLRKKITIGTFDLAKMVLGNKAYVAIRSKFIDNSSRNEYKT